MCFFIGVAAYAVGYVMAGTCLFLYKTLIYMAACDLRFAVFGNIYQSKKSANICHILSCLSRRGASVCMERQFRDFLLSCGMNDVKTVEVFNGNSFDADFVISMGGDGTLLKAASHVGNRGIPIVGVNMGRLGFLANVSADGIDEAVDALSCGRYDIEEHTVIQVTADGEPLSNCGCAINDVSILKRDNASMISIDASVDGEHVVTYRADGLIVTTPTGSTAYSLSNGGPIIVPRTGTLCLTPVAPHSLNVRPIVIPDDAVVTLRVESRNHNFLIAADGRSEDCRDSVCLEIRKAPYIIKTVRTDGQGYFATLREKMMWGADRRM